MNLSASGERKRSAASDGHGSATTFGAEEEFLLVDPNDCRVTPRAEAVLAEIPVAYRQFIQHELHRTQLEIATPVCRTLAELRWWLARLRGEAAAAARRVGCRMMAAGTGLLGYDGAPPLSPGERYRLMGADFGALVAVEGVCATHVHVGVENRDLAIAVSNWLRLQLPLLQALCANSPFAGGRDTGYASWRSIMWSRWPTAGPAPRWRSSEHYDQALQELVDSGAMLDRKMAYWYCRPSERYPTIELRVGDVCPTLDETLLVAALARALVATDLDHIRRGNDAPDVDDQLVRAAHWRAARDGLEGEGLHLPDTRLRPGRDLLDVVMAESRAALLARNDWDEVSRLVEQLKTNGSGAARQRAVYSATSDLRDVVLFLTDETCRGTHVEEESTVEQPV